MFNPVSTYRIQFHKGFDFDDFAGIIPYLEKLGVKTVYASPVFKAAPGSMHGYDGVDPLQINPEIGTIKQLRKISNILKEKNIGWLQDIVPNHMAYHQDNRWLMDVLENGLSSGYKDFFDSSLTDELLFNGAVMAPFLGSSLDDVINNGELSVEEHDDKMVFKYAGQHWPLKPGSYPENKAMAAVNKDKVLLRSIADRQHYRLCSYKETDSVINFRRFFTVNTLICLNIQDDGVFEHIHRLIIQLVKEGVFQGLRIDHIDGLYDPAKYLEQLRKAAGDDTYIVVEKILEKGEHMASWPVQGNTGYDFLALVNNLLTGKASKEKFNDFYKTLSQDSHSVSRQVQHKKAYILENYMGGELDNLTNLFITSGSVKTSDVPINYIKQAIAQFLIGCPVYRFYGNSFPLDKKESDQLKKILSGVKDSHKELKKAVQLLETAFFHSKNNAKALHFYRRCMQFTGPLMAKGVEDTLMYTYNRFIGHNEVGDAPDAFAIAPDDFHKAMQRQKKHWPLSMNATATHDTKRGEDLRARLNALPDMATEWLDAVALWQQLNRDIKHQRAPDLNDEYFIYQTLMGAYPMPGEDEGDFAGRLQEYLQKTMREAKLHSDWAAPNEEYEAGVQAFASRLLNKKRPFWKSFAALHQKVAEHGIVNSLAQVMLKFTCPGTPDVYQGCEHWDLSLVDPDNRRPVDYQKRQLLLTKNISLKNLWNNKFNGQIKIWLTRLLMKERAANPLLFALGDYIPLEVKGKYAANIFAFARSYKLTWYITVVPLNLTELSVTDWGDTVLLLSADAPETYENLITKVKGKQQRQLLLNDIFKELPLALLKLEHSNVERGAGILMHITSLPSKFGIGDFGPAARVFAGKLHNSHQKYWQLLPLSPVDAQSGYSPYSAISGMAGNTLLLSPELLAWEGGFNIDDYILPQTGKVDFKEVSIIKQLLFDKAWSAFKKTGEEALKSGFVEFCKKETGWLNDYALYTVLKHRHENKPWHQWPDEFKFRSKKALVAFVKSNDDAIRKEKWLQYQFGRQWSRLKTYCNQLQIQLFGDLPFYVSYDSADVWVHPELFSLDDQGGMAQVAGVPPDYFSADGQLWGMPVYRWDKLKAQGYQWWIQRLRKNLERFDLLRLDHFRAFVNYWSVPANEQTAINGKWEQGPGEDLFNTIKKEFGRLPFIAEDLGDIDETVYRLRDDFELPGMRVLQFAFGGAGAVSPHLPHNYSENSVVYTGTHDNNTVRGWYTNEADKSVRKQLENYAGSKIKADNINKTFRRMAIASVAKITIIPMQDLLDLDEGSRMNTPGAAEGNWTWQQADNDQAHKEFKKLKKMTKLYNRL